MTELTQGLGSTCGVMMPWVVISFIWASTSSLTSVEVVSLLCCTGGLLGTGVMLYLPEILPILSKETGNISLRSSMLLMVIQSFNGRLEVECLCDGGTDDL